MQKLGEITLWLDVIKQNATWAHIQHAMAPLRYIKLNVFRLEHIIHTKDFRALLHINDQTPQQTAWLMTTRLLLKKLVCHWKQIYIGGMSCWQNNP